MIPFYPKIVTLVVGVATFFVYTFWYKKNDNHGVDKKASEEDTKTCKPIAACSSPKRESLKTGHNTSFQVDPVGQKPSAKKSAATLLKELDESHHPRAKLSETVMVFPSRTPTPKSVYMSSEASGTPSGPPASVYVADSPTVTASQSVETRPTAVSSSSSTTSIGTVMELPCGKKVKSGRIHQCFCPSKGRMTKDEAWPFDEKVKPTLLPTEIHPISYAPYEPLNLLKAPKGDTALAKEVLERPKRAEPNYLSVFNPILHAIAYADAHVTMLEDLIANKDFFDE